MRRGFISISLLAFSGVNALAEPPANPRLIERYEQMLAGHPSEGLALDRLWKIYADAGRSDELLADYKKQQNTFSGALISGWFLEKSGRNADARTAFATAAKLDPKSAVPHVALAKLLADQPAQAAAEWEQAAALDPSPDNLLALGNAWFAANDSAKAGAAWERAMALDPQNLTLRAQLAANYEQQHLPEKALLHYAYLAAHAAPSESAPAWQNVARLDEAMGRNEAAETALDTALDLTAPGNWLHTALETQLIRLAQRTGRLETLTERWQKAVTANPRDLGAYWKLADLYQQTGDAKNERSWLEKMAALAPDNRELAHRLARAEQADGDPQAAAKTLDGLLQDQPDDSSLLFERADLDLQLEHPQDAVARLEALVQAHGGDQALERRVLDFYRRARLMDALDARLRLDAARGETETLELAHFLFSERRDSEAGRVLEGLVHPQDPAAQQAAAWQKIAAVWKENAHPKEAENALRKAITISPQTAALHTALADLLNGEGQFPAARSELQAAYQLDPSEANDQKLFQSFQTESIQQSPPVPNAPFLSEGGETPSARQSPQLSRFIAALARDATRSKRPADFLRTARWLLWCQRNDEALRFAQGALLADANSLTARQLILQITLAGQNKQAALDQLQKLIALDPKHAADWRRQRAQLQLDLGNFEDALPAFEALAKVNPGDPNALADLAVAQQRADRWSDALLTWQRAYSLAPATQRREISQPLVHAMEHLGLYPKAAELLLANVDAAGDSDQRGQNLGDLIRFCSDHDLTAWLKQQLDQRHRADASDLATTRALAALARAAGQPEEALRLLSEAADQSPDDPSALHEVVKLARELNRPQAALAQQRQLVQAAAPNDPTEAEILVQLEEEAGDLAGATRTRQQLARQFPRDVDLLTKAADFFLRWVDDDAAQETLRRVRVLDPANLAALQNLARIAAPAEALSCYEQILANTKPAAPDDAPHFPDVDSGQFIGAQQSYFRALQLRHASVSGAVVQHLRSFWSDSDAKLTGDAAYRLPAIRATSLLLAGQGNAATLRDWLARWNSGGDLEALWAHYYADDHPGTLHILNRMLTRDPNDVQTRQAYLWLSLRMQEYAQLSRWLGAPERKPEDSDLMLVALGRYLADSPGDPKLAAELFPANAHLGFLEWQTALLLAAQDKLADAIALGEDVFAKAGLLRASYGLQLAHWQLCLGELPAAEKTLRASVQMAGSTLDDPVYAPLREAVLLQPETQRAAFEAGYLARWKNDVLHAANARLLFAALAEDAPAIQSAVQALLALAPTPVRPGDDFDSPHQYRYWAFVLNTGLQLQNWRLDAAARSFWSAALQDEAGVALATDQVPDAIREIRLRLLASRIVDAEPGVQSFLLNDYAARAPLDSVATLGAVLESNGCYSPALQIYQLVVQRDPANQQALRGLINTARISNDLDAPRAALLALAKQAVSSTDHPENSRPYVNDALDLLLRRNERTEARKLLDQLLQATPKDGFWLERSAQFYQAGGDDRRAEEAYRKLLAVAPGNASASNALGDLLRSEGRDAEAAKLQKERPPVISAPSPFSRFSSRDAAQELCDAAAQLARNGQSAEARALLCSAIAKGTELGDRFQYQLQLARTLAPGDALLKPLLNKLHDELGDLSAPDNRSSIAAYYDFLQHLAKTTHRDFHAQLEADWNHGDGLEQAGLALLTWGTTSDAQAAALGKTFLEKAPSMSEPTLNEAAQALANRAQKEAAFALRRAIAAQQPSQYQNSLQLADALKAAGKDPEALALLDQIAARSLFNPGVAQPVAQRYTDWKKPAEAGKYWIIAIRNDPAAQNSDLWNHYVNYLEQTSADGLGPALRKAYSNRTNLDFAPLFALLPAGDGEAESAAALLARANLSETQQQAFWRVLVARAAADNRSDEALALAKAHLEAVIADRTSLDSLVMLAGATAHYAEIAAVLEPFAAQRSEDFPWLPGALADLEVAWAKQERPANPPEALAHLRRAAELTPLRFPIIEQLCHAYVENQQRALAVTTLHQFLAATRNEHDKAKALKLLETI